MLPPRLIPGCQIAALPTPRNSQFGPLRHLVSTLAPARVDGIALGTFPGEGSRISAESWERLLAAGREGLDDRQIVIASVGASSEVRRPEEVNAAARNQAALVAKQGGHLVLVQPPTAIRGRPERDRLVLEYHSEVAEAGLPLLISIRREVSGGIAYPPEVLAQLLARPEVVGLEIATFDAITIFQQVEALAREFAPEKVVISGEERFLGYSLMCGAQAALVGISAAYPERVGELLEAHRSGDADRFLKRSIEIDALARPIFRAPFDGSSRRLIQALIGLGKLPIAAFDDY